MEYSNRVFQGPTAMLKFVHGSANKKVFSAAATVAESGGKHCLPDRCQGPSRNLRAQFFEGLPQSAYGERARVPRSRGQATERCLNLFRRNCGEI